MALDEALILAVGVGCRTAATADEIAALVSRVLAGFDEWQARLFTLERKLAHPGLRAAADRLGLSLTGLPADLLDGQAVTTRSARVAAAVGVFSVAEAAALAGAGPGARLLVPRTATGGVTCAVACVGAPGLQSRM